MAGNDKFITITSGEEFTVPGGCVITINGLPSGDEFTIKETGRARVWASPGDGYRETDELSGTAGENEWFYFSSAKNAGQITIGVKADGTPKDGYPLTLELEGMENAELMCMDAWGNPLGCINTDKDGKVTVMMSAGDELSLQDIPENTKFTLSADNAGDFKVREIFISDGLKASGRIVTGTADARVAYRYEKASSDVPQITMEQSASGDWGISDITLEHGSLVSYNVIVKNPGSEAVSIVAADTVPEGLEIVKSSLLDERDLDGDVVSRPVTLEAGSSVELSFTCRVTADGPCEIKNNARILMDGKTIGESNTVNINVKE